MHSQIVDAFGRFHNNLRISVTDRCNIRCFYCMPDEKIRFLPHASILTFEEIEQFVQAASGLGIDRIRITGGEPLVRCELDKLIRLLVDVPGIRDVALTTNGLLLAEQAAALKAAGLHRLNISLDTLNEEIFRKISRRNGLHRVLDGIDAAIAAGFARIRLNAISIAQLTESEIVPLVQFATRKGLEIRFIEFMPLDAEQNWNTESVLTGEKVKAIIEHALGPLEPAERRDASQPAIDYRFRDGSGIVGFINPVSQPFCDHCNRLRITAEGKLRNCLFSRQEWDVRSLIRSGADAVQIQQRILDCVAAKKRAHGIDSKEFQRPQRAMYQIGG